MNLDKRTPKLRLGVPHTTHMFLDSIAALQDDHRDPIGRDASSRMTIEVILPPPTMATAINIFARTVVREGRIPFEVSSLKTAPLMVADVRGF